MAQIYSAAISALAPYCTLEAAKDLIQILTSCPPDVFSAIQCDVETGVCIILWSQLANAIKDWIVNNAGQTVLLVVDGVVFITPVVLTGPLLFLLGFGNIGVRTGELTRPSPFKLT